MKRILFFLPLLAIISCTVSESGSNNANDSVPKADTTDLPSPAAPLPDIPADIDRPSQKADYVMLHFWDGIDFADEGVRNDRMLVEQTFADFIEILPRTSSVEAASNAIDALYDKADVNTDAYLMMADMADKYLYTEDSPMRNRRLYTYFLKRILIGQQLSADKKQHFVSQLNELGEQQSSN